MTPPPKQKVYWDIASSSDPHTTLKLDRYVTELSVGCKQPMHPINLSVKISPHHLAGKVKLLFKSMDLNLRPPSSAVRNPFLEQMSTPPPKEIPVKAVPGASEGSAREGSSRKRDVIPIEDRGWICIPCADEVSTKSLLYPKGMIMLLRSSHRLRELDGVVPWQSLMHNFKGFEAQLTGWTVEDWKTCTDKIRFEYCLD